MIQATGYIYVMSHAENRQERESIPLYIINNIISIRRPSY